MLPNIHFGDFFSHFGGSDRLKADVGVGLSSKTPHETATPISVLPLLHQDFMGQQAG